MQLAERAAEQLAQDGDVTVARRLVGSGMCVLSQAWSCRIGCQGVGEAVSVVADLAQDPGTELVPTLGELATMAESGWAAKASSMAASRWVRVSLIASNCRIRPRRAVRERARRRRAAASRAAGTLLQQGLLRRPLLGCGRPAQLCESSSCTSSWRRWLWICGAGHWEGDLLVGRYVRCSLITG